MSEYCPTPGTPGDIILCDFSRYIVAMREQLRADLSIHVKFLTDEQAFRFVMRVNGTPIDTRPLTPLYGTQATSSFVALAQR
jgi:HK97 family phage major capsid protein